MGQPYQVYAWVVDAGEWRYELCWEGRSRIVALFKLWQVRRQHPGHAAKLELH